MPEHSAPSEPVTFGKYLLDEELARGGMSRVYRARLRGPGGFEKHLVVKQILPELAADPEFVKLFVKEANTLVQLSHPNLVPVFELGVVDSVYFLAMEWVQGATVEELLRAGPLPAPLVAQIGAQIADALHYAHERFGIVHRDVTPRNVIVDTTGHARLLDFGIAARVEHTGQGELFGSPGYMPPEQLRGEALGPASDLFALGCVLHEAISGKPAWPQVRSALELMACEQPAKLEGTDEALAALIAGLLNRDAAARPQPAGLVAERLRTWLSERHPRGLQGELAARVASSREQQQKQLPRGQQEPPRASSGRIEVRSIAVSQELSALLAQSTEKIAREPNRESPAPEPITTQRPPERMADDPELHRVAKRFLRDTLLLSVALLIALLYPRSHDDDDDQPKQDAQQASMAHDNPASQQPEASAPAGSAAPLAAAHGESGAPTTSSEAPSDAAVRSAPEPEGSAEQATSGAQEPSDTAMKRGFLSVSAVPWAEVRVDGRMLGATPRRSVPLRAGKHTLQLSCPPLARETSLTVDLEPDHELHVSANMHESPAQLTTQSTAR